MTGKCLLSLASRSLVFRLPAKVWHTEERCPFGRLTLLGCCPGETQAYTRASADAHARSGRGTSMHTAIAEIEQAQVRDDIPNFRPGDTLKVHVKVTEGNRSRI